ncbi:MAG: sigma-70 family RNA polymerase sigma factor [Planctomycetaceae bacterium]
MVADAADVLLVGRIRSGDADAWQDCIRRFEGRLFAFVKSRLNNSATSEDVVQETFMGFLVSLPNYDDRTPLESYLFSIAAHKLTDVLRRTGRRPTVPLSLPRSSSGGAEPEGDGRRASSLARSVEQRVAEQAVLGACLREFITEWRDRSEWERLECMELLFVLGWSNKNVARRLDISEQTVANHKHFVVNKLRVAAESRLRSFDPAVYGLA